jgi:hypothetical protein
MQSILETNDSWFLERLVYTDHLSLILVEGIKSSLMEITVGDINLGEGRSIDVTDKSRRITVSFEDVIAYQLQNESFTYRDQYEQGTEGILRVYERSRYLDFVRSHSLIDALRENRYTHYSLILIDEIIDVISGAEPELSEEPLDEVVM